MRPLRKNDELKEYSRCSGGRSSVSRPRSSRRSPNWKQSCRASVAKGRSACARILSRKQAVLEAKLAAEDGARGKGGSPYGQLLVAAAGDAGPLDPLLGVPYQGVDRRRLPSSALSAGSASVSPSRRARSPPAPATAGPRRPAPHQEILGLVAALRGDEHHGPRPVHRHRAIGPAPSIEGRSPR